MKMKLNSSMHKSNLKRRNRQQLIIMDFEEEVKLAHNWRGSFSPLTTTSPSYVTLSFLVHYHF